MELQTQTLKVYQVGNGLTPPAVAIVEDFRVNDDGEVTCPEGIVTIAQLFGDAFEDKDSSLKLEDSRFLFSPEDEKAAYELNPPKRTRKSKEQKLTEDQVRNILRDRAEQKLSFGKIGDLHQVSTYLVQKVCKGQICEDVESPHREAALKVDRSNTRKLNSEEVLEIRERYKAKESILQLAVDYNCSTVLIKDIVLGRSYTDVVDPNETNEEEVEVVENVMVEEESVENVTIEELEQVDELIDLEEVFEK